MKFKPYDPSGVTVLRPGKPLQTIVATCAKCESVLEIDPHECENAGWGFEVDCPHCSNMEKFAPSRFLRTDERQEEIWHETSDKADDK
jgi:hypothetical protein